MKGIYRSKSLTVILIISFIFLYSAYDLKAEETGKGNMIGFVYQKDGTAPIEGAVVKLRNVATGTGYESTKSDKLGIFKVEDVEEGLYLVGVSAEEGDFNLNNLIGIRANETAKVSFALKPGEEEQEAKPKAKPGGLAKFFLSPVGIAVVVAASAVIIYGVVKLSEKEPEASPFRR
jgi:hypothetical protein